MLDARVVIADNQPENLKMIKQLLSQVGLRVVGEAADGISALKLIRNFEPDLVIIEASLPGMSGMEVAEIIAQEMIAPVIIMSAHYGRDLIDKAKDALVMALLVKPIDRISLQAALEINLAHYEQIKELKLEVNKLKDLLESRKTIDKAKGLLMNKMGLSEADAFKKIQKQSMEKRKSMKDIAESIIIAYEI